MIVTLDWHFPECGGPRGDLFKNRSYDGCIMNRYPCEEWHKRCLATMPEIDKGELISMIEVRIVDDETAEPPDL